MLLILKRFCSLSPLIVLLVTHYFVNLFSNNIYNITAWLILPGMYVIVLLCDI